MPTNLPTPQHAQRLRSVTVLLAVVVVGSLLLGHHGVRRVIQSADAAPPQLILSNIRTVSVTSGSATIAWNTNNDADSTIEYGTTTALGTVTPTNLTMTKLHFMVIGPLNAGVTYWYKVRSTDATPTSEESTPRSFLTPGSSGDSAPPQLSEIRIDSIDTIAVLHFKTNEPAKWEVRWGETVALGRVNQQATLGVVHQTNLPDATTVPAAPAQLDPNTLYYYEIQVTDANGNQYTSAKFSFRTSGSAFDHVFTTGGCSDGTPIGQCNAGNQFCDGGTLVSDCTKCGVTCPIGQTCTVASSGGGACSADPGLSGNAFQCNKDECYNGTNFKLPAPPGCWSTWPRCSANIVLKVKKDRVCDTWISCSESQEITRADTGTKDDLCVGAGACSSLGPGGTCNQFLGTGQCSDDPLRFCNSNNDCEAGQTCTTVISSTQHYRPITYPTPAKVSKIQNLTGSIVAGLDWGSAKGVIEGQYPWFLAPQWGEKIEIQSGPVPKGDFEYPARTLNARRSSPNEAFAVQNIDQSQISIDLEEEKLDEGQNNLNHVLKVKPCKDAAGLLCLDQNSLIEVPKNGFNAFPTLDYFVKFRIRTRGETNGVRVQYASGSTSGTCVLSPATSCTNSPQCDAITPGDTCNIVPTTYKTLAEIVVTSSWKEYQFGPVPGLSGNTTLRIYFLPSASNQAEKGCRGDPATPNLPCGSDTECAAFVDQTCSPAGTDKTVLFDDISISPVLESRPNEYVFPTCRLFPQEDAEACKYISDSGAKYQGQLGYCLERDSKDPNLCIAWWPVDAIRGEENAFGIEKSAGYGGSLPTYYCAQNRYYSLSPAAFQTGCVDGGGGRCKSSDCNQGQATCPAHYAPDPGTFRCGGICDVDWGPDDCHYDCVHDGTPLAVNEYDGSNYLGGAVENRCAIVVKVADYGENAAWAQRVQQGSAYAITPLTGLDLPVPPSRLAQIPASTSPQTTDSYQVEYPFGRITAPEPVSDPTQWAEIAIRSTCTDPAADPLLCAGQTPPQSAGNAAGSAAPYAWTYPYQGSGGFCTAGPNALRDAACPGDGYCKKNLTGPPAICSNDGSACASDLTCRLGANYLACSFIPPNNMGTCEGTATACHLNKVCPNAITECTAAIGSLDAACGGTCDLTTPPIPGPGAACTTDAFCTLGHTCIPALASICGIPDTVCNPGVSCLPAVVVDGQPIRQCSNDPLPNPLDGKGRCSDAAGHPIALQSCTADSECAKTQMFCKEVPTSWWGQEGRCFDIPGNALTGTPCQRDSDCSYCIKPQVCTRNEDCFVTQCVPAPAAPSGICPNGTTACRSSEDCYAPGNNVCQSSGNTCSNDGTIACKSDRDCVAEVCSNEGSSSFARCVSIKTFTIESVQTAVNRLKRIFAQQYGVWYFDQNQNQYIECSSGACGGFNTGGPGYADPGGAGAIFGYFTQWQIPKTQCVGDRDPTGNDWCGNPPQVLNAKWKGGETFISINRGEQATLTFNTKADPEQKPLKRILIDWTGNGAIRTYEFPYDSKEDPNNPHVFRFAYSNLNPTASVTYTPKVLVMDNWGWCNNGATNDICKEDVLNWIPLGVSIEVQ